MARTRTVNGKRVRAKQTRLQRDECRKRHIALAKNLTGTRQSFTKEAVGLAKKHGRNSLFSVHKIYLRLDY
jgi:hypothetical protein